MNRGMRLPSFGEIYFIGQIIGLGLYDMYWADDPKNRYVVSSALPGTVYSTGSIYDTLSTKCVK